jgi:hypothetical protein
MRRAARNLRKPARIEWAEHHALSWPGDDAASLTVNQRVRHAAHSEALGDEGLADKSPHERDDKGSDDEHRSALNFPCAFGLR